MKLARWSQKLVGQPQRKQRVVALVLKKDKVVATGYNSYTKTHPLQAKLAKKVGQEKRQYLHAEIAALLKAPKDADELIVLRINRKGELCNAKPCPVCQEAIKLFGIKSVFWST